MEEKTARIDTDAGKEAGVTRLKKERRVTGGIRKAKN